MLELELCQEPRKEEAKEDVANCQDIPGGPWLFVGGTHGPLVKADWERLPLGCWTKTAEMLGAGTLCS